MAVHLNVPRDLKYSASCCEIFLHAKICSPEISPWHFGVHTVKESSDYGITLKENH